MYELSNLLYDDKCVMLQKLSKQEITRQLAMLRNMQSIQQKPLRNHLCEMWVAIHRVKWNYSHLMMVKLYILNFTMKLPSSAWLLTYTVCPSLSTTGL